MSLSTASEHAGAWRRPGPAVLHYRQWQDDVVLFNEVSGATHLLTPEALVVLQHMDITPTPEAALAVILREHFEVDDATLAHDVAELLEQLSSLNLIEPCLL